MLPLVSDSLVLDIDEPPELAFAQHLEDKRLA
jgi:hypothetical protein